MDEAMLATDVTRGRIIRLSRALVQDGTKLPSMLEVVVVLLQQRNN